MAKLEATGGWGGAAWGKRAGIIAVQSEGDKSISAGSRLAGTLAPREGHVVVLTATECYWLPSKRLIICALPYSLGARAGIACSDAPNRRRLHLMLRCLLRVFRADRVAPATPKSFLDEVRGVIHIGANRGQERGDYAASGLNVLWIEPIPDVFDELKANISHLPRQRAVQCLISDRDDEEYVFNISNNEGLSSSIFGLHQHKDIWPDVAYTRTIVLKSQKLSTLVRNEGVDMKAYDAMVIDTQGSELLVLKGAESILPHIKYIKAEAADFESYAGGCTAQQLIDYLANFGFRVMSRHAFAERAAGGTYFDLTFSRMASAA